MWADSQLQVGLLEPKFNVERTREMREKADKGSLR